MYKLKSSGKIVKVFGFMNGGKIASIAYWDKWHRYVKRKVKTDSLEKMY